MTALLNLLNFITCKTSNNIKQVVDLADSTTPADLADNTPDVADNTTDVAKELHYLSTTLIRYTEVEFSQGANVLTSLSERKCSKNRLLGD